MDEQRLIVRAAGRAWEVVDEEPRTVQVDGRGLLEVEVIGAPGVEVELRVEGELVPLRGTVLRQWSSERLLRTRAGRVVVEARIGGRVRAAWLEVQPTKLTLTAVRALLEDRDALAEALSTRLGSGPAAHDPAALVEALDALIGPLSEAASALRRHPLHRRREVVRAVPASSAAARGRDVRWLSQNPSAALRASGGVRQVAVQREVERNLDVVENRGVVGLFVRLADALERADELVRLATERHRARQVLLGEAPRERGWRDPLEVPLTALGERRARLVQLREAVEWARRRTGLPSSLPTTPRLPMTHAVCTEPAYWRMHEVERALGELALRAPLSVEAVPDLDRLYEQWCALQVAVAVAAWAGVVWTELLEVQLDGDLVRLPPGPLLTLQVGDRTVRVLTEPSYDNGGEGPLVKLQPGRPWCPDVVIELSRAGRPYRLHVFDAKHRRDPARAHDGWMPLEALQEIWFSYGDGIGDRDTGHPVVGSVWMMWPGEGAQRTLRAPTMLGKDWPEERVRGGAICLRPDRRETRATLRETVAVLLDQEGLKPDRS